MGDAACLGYRPRHPAAVLTPVYIWEDADAAAVVRSVNNGDELVPTVRIGERYLSNPTLGEVRGALARD